MGARKTGDFLEKTTWTLAIVLVSLALLSNFAIEKNNPGNQSRVTEVEVDVEANEEDVDWNDIDIQQQINNMSSDSL